MDPVIETYSLLTLASGDPLSLQQYRFVGTKRGKVVYLQANLHGAELAGNVVIHQLIEYLRTLDSQFLQGEIRLVPACNPIGVNTRAHQFASGRFNPYDGRDWNRIFWDYEQVCEGARTFAGQYLNQDIAKIQQAYRQAILARFQSELNTLNSPMGVPVHQRYRTCLQHLALDADIVIDLHTSGNQGMVYLYYFRDRTSLVPYFGVDFALLLDNFDGDAFDEAFINPWLALESAFAELGRPLQFDIDAWTLELGCGLQINPVAVQRGLAGVLNYLRCRDVLTDLPPERHADVPLSRSSQRMKYYATQGGFIQNRVALGTWVKTGDLLFELLCLNKTQQLPKILRVYAQQAGLVYDLVWNHAVSEGEYVLALMVPDT
ncbi:MAG: succinylglutamate desuccinylase/aspartoacylase family protein [Cyanobacteria bacterium J06639_14]